MTISNRHREHLLGALTFVNLLFLLLPPDLGQWEYTVAVTPWLLVLCWPQARQNLRGICQSRTLLTTLSVSSSVFILLGALARPTSNEWRAAVIPLIWLPIAALASSKQTHDTAKNIQLVTTSLMLAVFSTTLLLNWQLWIDKDPRPPGFSFNVLTGPMLLMMACIHWAFTSLRPQPRSNAGNILISVAALIGAITTQSKAALITFVCASLAATIISPNTLKRTLLTTTPIIIAWATLIFKRFKIIQTDIHTYQQGNYSSSFGDRLDAIKWGLSHLFDKAWLGFGPEPLRTAFNMRWLEWSRPENSITKILHLHNDYLQIPLAYGIPLLICILGIWGALCWAIKRADVPHDTKLFLMLMVVILATASTTDSFTYWNGVWSMCMACAGLAIAACTYTPKPKSPAL